MVGAASRREYDRGKMRLDDSTELVEGRSHKNLEPI